MDYVITFEDGSTGYLSHFGVKGMHWGVWNEETRQRRTGAKKPKSAKSASANGNGSGKGKTLSFKESDKAFKKRLRNAGYSNQQVKDMAEGRDALKKAAIAGLAIVGVAAVGLIGYQAVQRYGSITLKQGSLIQTVHSNSRPIEERVKGPFYASFKKGDNLVYSHTFGRLSKDHTISKLAAQQDIHIASEAKAHAVFKKMIKDNPTVSWTGPGKSLNPTTGKWETKDHTFTMPFTSYLGTMGISTKGRSIDAYREFQSKFGTNTNMKAVAGRNMFYDRLKATGFNAMMDSHNANQNGGFTRRPFIVFGDVKFNVASQSPVNLSGKEAIRNKLKASVYSTGHNMANTPLYKNGALLPSMSYATMVGAGSAGLLGIQEHSIRGREKFIKSYKQEHPGTNLSDAQIGKMYE